MHIVSTALSFASICITRLAPKVPELRNRRATPISESAPLATPIDRFAAPKHELGRRQPVVEQKCKAFHKFCLLTVLAPFWRVKLPAMQLGDCSV
jgi:hypothetical protein